MATVSTSGTFAAAVNGSGMTGYWAWSDSATDAQQAANKSTVTVSLYVSKNSGSTTSSDNFIGYITINGNRQDFGRTRWSISAVTTNLLIITRSLEITHDANGSKSIAVSGDYGDDPDGPPPLASWTSSAGSATIPLYDFTRAPNTPASAPTIVRNGTSLTLTSAVSAPLSPVGPAISYEYHYRTSTNGTSWSSWIPSSSTGTAMATPPSSTSITGLSATTFYQYQTRAKSSEGNSAWSASATAYVIPSFQNVDGSGNITTLPDVAIFSVPFAGTVSATNADSISITSGTSLSSLGLTTTSSTVSGTTTLTISGSPTSAGLYTFRYTATGPGGSATSAFQTLKIGAAGPWVYSNSSPDDINITNVSVAAFNASYNLATLTTAAHGITEKNQPITISGISGTYSTLNGAQTIYSVPSSTSLGILVPTSVTGSGSVTGILERYYSRSVPQVYDGTQWVPAFMRIYDPTYTDAAGTNWRPLS